LVGLLSLKGENVYSLIVEMLKTLAHRGPSRVWLSFGGRVIHLSKRLDGVEAHETSWAIGGNLMETDGVDGLEPRFSKPGRRLLLAGAGSLFAVEGFPPPPSPKGHSWSEVSEAFQRGWDGSLGEALGRVMRRLYGSYILAVASEGRIAFGRDPVGAEPLYFGVNRHLVGFASEGKALWKVGIGETKALPSGFVGEASSSGLRVFEACKLPEKRAEVTEMEEAAERVHRRLLEACRLRAEGLRKVGVFYSGGLDSSLIALALRRLGLEVTLLVSGLEGSRDVESAEEAAGRLGLKLKITPFDRKDVEAQLERLVYSIERCGPMDVAVTLPLYFSSQAAEEEELKNVFSGQGCDELFGGYHRYLKILQEKGFEGLEKALWQDVQGLAGSLERDNMATAAGGVRIHFPAADLRVVGEAGRIHPRLKVSSGEDRLRKQVLRRVAEKMGAPSFIVKMPKKAVQYGSGSQRILKLLAREKGETVKSYLAEVFQRVYSRAFGKAEEDRGGSN
jgi:asparagine synthase (glutamine-hydrolysing)